MKRQLPAVLLLITLIFSLAAGTISYADPGPGIDIRLTTAHSNQPSFTRGQRKDRN